MDTLTHIVAGACIGEAIAGKALGKKAMLFGAIAQSIPDIDFIAYAWLDELDGIIMHRGITHSLLFIFLVTLLMGFLINKKYRHAPLLSCFALFGFNLLFHLFIDSTNAYGTGWFEPFDHSRISFHLLFVIDPFFSVWPFFGALLLLLSKKEYKRRKWYWIGGMGISLLYLLYAFNNKMEVKKDVQENIVLQNISENDYFITPAPFNAWLWYVVVKDKKGYHIAYRSVFDSKKEIKFGYVLQNDSLLNKPKNQDELDKLKRFAEGFYTAEKHSDTLTFNILRFGQVIGWDDPKERFVFYYYMDRTGDNEMVVQRGRFEKWNKTTISSFIRRIKGN